MDNIVCKEDNFHEKLYSALCSEHISTDNECLICGDELGDDHVELECGHKFNYDCILHEAKKQKLNSNKLEVVKLKKNQIKCPYCRVVQNGLLPYTNGEKINNVNYPPSLVYMKYRCEYIFVSGKKKGLPCNKRCSKKMCERHIGITSNTFYCKHILKRGKRKGQECGATTKHHSYCRRHLKINQVQV